MPRGRQAPRLDRRRGGREFAAMNQRTVARPKLNRPDQQRGSLEFSAINGVLLAAGLASVVMGYVLLAGGSTVGAPLLLVLGYAVLLPLGIIR